MHCDARLRGNDMRRPRPCFASCSSTQPWAVVRGAGQKADGTTGRGLDDRVLRHATRPVAVARAPAALVAPGPARGDNHADL